MCLILFALGVSERYPLVLAANRDEYHDRPAAAAGYWPPENAVLGGRDLSAGGSWLAASRNGRLAAVTNHRNGTGRKGARSRGHLVSGFVEGNLEAAAHLDALAPVRSEYGGFNLLLWQRDGLRYTSNHGAGDQTVEPGVHGLSNDALDTPWPKVIVGTRRLTALLRRDTRDPADELLALLHDRAEAPDDALPNTGVTLEWERRLSAPFIVSEQYGTRATTVVLIDSEGRLTFVERSFDRQGEVSAEHRFLVNGFVSG